MDDEDDLDLDFVAVNTSTIAPNAVERHNQMLSQQQTPGMVPEWEMTAEDERAALEDDDDDVKLF